MSIDGVNGVNAQTNTSGICETKAPNEESGDKSIFENIKDAALAGTTAGTQGIISTYEQLPENVKNAAFAGVEMAKSAGEAIFDTLGDRAQNIDEES